MIDPGTLLGIAVVTAATVFNRCAGFFLMRLVPITPRVRRILDCLPGSVLVAMLAPGAAKGDIATIAGLATALVSAKLVRSDIVPVASAMAVAAGLRAMLG